MDNFNTWLQEQNRIYQKFRDKAGLLKTQGTNLPERFQKPTRGYFVVFRLPKAARNKLGEISKNISELTPAITYKPEIMHITLSDHGIVPANEFSQDNKILDGICSGINQSLAQLKAPKVELGDLLYNPDTVLVEGQPNKKFFDACNTVIRNTKEHDVSLRDPWGAHATITRFSEKRIPDLLITGLISYLKNIPPLNKSIILPNIEVGTFYLDPHNLEQNKYAAFNLAD